MNRTTTLAGYAVIGVVLMGLQLYAQRRRSGNHTFRQLTAGELAAWLRAGWLRWPLLLVWLWVGWHVFVRVHWK